MIKKIKEWLQSTNSESNQKRPIKSYVLLVGLLGLLFMILGSIFSPSKKEVQPDVKLPEQYNMESKETNSETSSVTADVNELETSYKKQLEGMLENIEGVSEVEVMINLDSTNVKVYERNLITGKQLTDENDKNGGTRQIEDNTEETQVVIVRQGDKETPLLVQTKKPPVRGVFVVAKGVEKATVKQWVVEAVSRVLDVPTHQVSVLPKK